YRELMRAARIWRLLKLLKWSGKGDLVLFCPACPQLGINLSPAEEADLSHWKYTRTVVMDGNFKAEHMHDRWPDDQVCLMDGQGYMVGRERYQHYLKATNYPRSKCNNHRAVNQANANQHKLEVTGIGGCACACHGCFIPHAMVDFQKGEQFVLLGLHPLLSSLTVQASQHGLCPLPHFVLQHDMTQVHRVLSFYDINCQYMKNLRKRLTGNAFINIPAELPIVPSIGIWHVHSHQMECHARYAPSFIPGAGCIDGKIIETL
ncbi:hypothetical protein PAXRUDRAFT_177160, partial [Paxillus rubicundulus Ve08.2h10]